MSTAQKIQGAILAGAFLAVTSAAQAATFQGSFDVTYNSSDPGLVVEVDPAAGNFGPFEIGVGESHTFKLFKIWTEESWVNEDDTTPHDISVDFGFTSPEASGSLSGTTVGVTTLWGLLQLGEVTWNNPMKLTFGPRDSGELFVTLTDRFFSEGVLGLDGTAKGGANVYATIEYATAPIPLPAAGWLLLGGLASLAALKRRRKTA